MISTYSHDNCATLHVTLLHQRGEIHRPHTYSSAYLTVQHEGGYNSTEL
jgi:hypothetical protein